MTKWSGILTRQNINDHVSCVALHHATEYAEEAAALIGKQWNHKDREVERNIRSMLEESKDNLPCHLALLLNVPQAEQVEEKCEVEVVGHLKLVRAASRGDGTACIMYSLVVDEEFRGLGLGRLLTEEGEKYAQELNISYMYLFTDDKVTFYEHIGYKQCEPISSLGKNANRLNVKQLSALENLFAKSQNVESCSGHTWLRKRLMLEYPYCDPLDLVTTAKGILTGVENFRYYSQEEKGSQKMYFGFVNRIRWQQQTGPSCGISALNMLKAYLDDCQRCNRVTSTCIENTKVEMSYCHCTGKSKMVDVDSACDSMLDFALNSGVTNDGEMFCAYNLAIMSQAFHHLKLDIKHIHHRTSVELTNGTDVDSTKISDMSMEDALDAHKVLPSKIVQSVCKGVPVLIPYDKSNLYTPAQLEGHHAHWALITGIILPRNYENSFHHENLVSSMQRFGEETEVEVFDLTSVVDVDVLDIDADAACSWSSDLLLVCMHGMCEKSFVCSYNDMIASNGQMRTTKSKFYLASDGLVHLRNKIIFVE